MSFEHSDLELSQLNSLDSTAVQDLIDRLAAQLQELNPSLDLKRGVFKDTVLYLHAVLEAAIRTNIDRYQSARSLLKIQEDPSLADETVVNEVLSNWGVTRKEGTKAVGTVVIELSSLQTVTVPQNSVFEANGKRYLATATFVGRTLSSQVATDTDRLISPLSNGNYAFTITVEAEDVGTAYKLTAGTLITPNKAITSYVTSYALSSFTDGTNTETNEELMQELQLGISAKSLSNRVNMLAWLRSLDDYADITNQSIIGFGDAEMLRDQHTILPISYGGRVDWYIRTQKPVQVVTKTVNAVLVSLNSEGSVWQFSINRDVLPAFYTVRKIVPTGSSGLNSGFKINSFGRYVDLTDLDFTPDVAVTIEGIFSPFQTAVIQFTDDVTPVSELNVGDIKSCDCEIVGLPSLRTIQDLVSSRDVRHYGADVLVKAPVPCFVSVGLTINKAAGDPDPDINGIKAAIVDLINSTDFIGRLDGSRVLETVHGFLSNNVSVTDLQLLGELIQPDGETKYITASDSLKIPYLPQVMVTEKTVQFFSEVSNIVINIVSSIPTAK